MGPLAAGSHTVDIVLVLAVGVAALVAGLTRHRGGRFRGMLGWVGFTAIFAVILIALARLPVWVGVTLLGLMMLAALRAYFFIAPVRPRDRYAILVAYIAVPFALAPGVSGSEATFLATVPIVLFLIFPALLSASADQKGLLDSMGRILLAVSVFVFCAAHLGLLAGESIESAWNLPPLFGVLVLATELPQRLIGRFRDGFSNASRALLGVVCGAMAAGAAGYRLGPACGLGEEDAARAGVLVAVAVTMGAVVSAAVVRDLGLVASEARVGRGALLDRAIPTLYAAPVFFHYLNHFA